MDQFFVVERDEPGLPIGIRGIDEPVRIETDTCGNVVGFVLEKEPVSRPCDECGGEEPLVHECLNCGRTGVLDY